MTTPTITSQVTPGLNSQPPIVAQIRALHDRLLRAEILASTGKVHQVVDMPDHYLVEGSKGPYLVQGGRCSCPDVASRNGLINGHCKHLLASMIYHQELGPAWTAKSVSNGLSTDKELEAKVADLYK
jgi:hypothetical protein